MTSCNKCDQPANQTLTVPATGSEGMKAVHLCKDHNIFAGKLSEQQADDVICDFWASGAGHDHEARIQADMEDGRIVITCLACGAQWYTVDTSNGLDYELVTEGDGTC